MKARDARQFLPHVPFEAKLNGHVVATGECVPDAITERMIERFTEARETMARDTSDLQKARDTGSVLATERAIIREAVVSWDLEGNDGGLLPIDDDTIKDLFQPLRAAIVEAVIGANRPNPETAS